MRRLCVAAALMVVAACAKGDRQTDTAAVASDPNTERARKAALVADAIEANPAAADSILRASGYTRESFETAMYEIAADSAMSETYVAAKAK